jgi:cell division protein FtsB
VSRKSKFKQRTSQSKVRIKPIKRRLNWRRLLILGFFFTLVVWSFYPLKYRFEQQRELAALKRQVALLQAQNEKLREDIARLKSDEYIEQLAREKFGLAKPGEEAYIVVDENLNLNKKNKQTVNNKAPRKEARNKVPLWRRIKEFLVKLFD